MKAEKNWFLDTIRTLKINRHTVHFFNVLKVYIDNKLIIDTVRYDKSDKFERISARKYL